MGTIFLGSNGPCCPSPVTELLVQGVPVLCPPFPGFSSVGVVDGPDGGPFIIICVAAAQPVNFQIILDTPVGPVVVTLPAGQTCASVAVPGLEPVGTVPLDATITDPCGNVTEIAGIVAPVCILPSFTSAVTTPGVAGNSVLTLTFSVPLGFAISASAQIISGGQIATGAGAAAAAATSITIPLNKRLAVGGAFAGSVTVQTPCGPAVIPVSGTVAAA